MQEALAKEGLVHECVSCRITIKTEAPTGGLTGSRLVESMCDHCVDALVHGDRAFKSRPRRHQAALYPRVMDMRYFALHWEMGLGKTKLICDVASHHFFMGRIDAMLVLAPNEVYTNWLSEEVPIHLGAPWVGMALKTRKSKLESEQMKMLMMLNPDDSDFKGSLRFVCASYDSLRVDRTWDFLKKFVKIFRCMIVSDESSKLKNPKTEQAKRSKELAENCFYKWEATGTPATETPFSLHSQIEFLDPSFWAGHGMRSISAFKTEFGEFHLRRAGKRVFKELKQYRNLDKLQRIVKPISHRLLKEDAGVDLPPKVYTTYRFELSDAQLKVYRELRDEYVAEIGSGMVLEAPMAIVRLTRLQQICSGHVNVDELTDTVDEEAEQQLAFDIPESLSGETLKQNESYEDFYERIKQGVKDAAVVPAEDSIADTMMAEIKPMRTERRTIDVVPPGENPRLKLLLELVDVARGKVIVFCRFTRDVDMICEALGDVALRYDGSTKHGVRPGLLKRYRDATDPARVLVANVHAMSMGVTLTIAKTMIFFSNSFSLEKRLQAEDRFHRIGQDQSVQIIDLVAEGTVDEHVVKSMREKFDIQRLVTGDRFREWIG